MTRRGLSQQARPASARRTGAKRDTTSGHGARLQYTRSHENGIVWRDFSFEPTGDESGSYGETAGPAAPTHESQGLGRGVGEGVFLAVAVQSWMRR